ncbi:MAG: hypothetical protein ACOYNY_36830 [Caldilineaceae bacterium]
MTLEERVVHLENQVAELLQRLNKRPSLEPQGSFLAVDRASFTSVTLPSSGATEPKAKINLEGLAQDEEGGLINGITWASDEPQNFGIYRTPGAWGESGFQQLQIKWKTGIILDPGIAAGSTHKGYLLVNGNTHLEGTVYIKDVGLLHEVIDRLIKRHLNARSGDDRRLVTTSESGNGSGFLETYHPNGNPAVTLTTLQGENVGGYLGIANGAGQRTARLSDSLGIYNADGQQVAQVATAGEEGFIGTYLRNGKPAVRLTTLQGENVGGYLGIFNGAEQRTAHLSDSLGIYNADGQQIVQIARAEQEGFIGTYHRNGNPAVRLTTLIGENAGGYLSIFNGAAQRTAHLSDSLGIYNVDGTLIATITTTTGQEGFIQTYQRNGKPAVRLTTVAGENSGGYIAVYDGNGEAKTFLSGNGTKNFVMPHPHDETKQIIYSALEGPEAAAYLRGKTKLSQGQAEIVLPEHFALVVNPSTLTINLTPRDPLSKGLAIAAQSATSVKGHRK